MSEAFVPYVGYTGEGDPGWPVCKCGLGAILKDAWTEENAGRRFYGCQNYGKPSFCGFHCWYDAETPRHLKETILGLRYDGKDAWRKWEAAVAEVEMLKKLLVESEARVQELKERSDHLANELAYVDYEFNDAYDELKALKEEVRSLRGEVKDLEGQRLWFFITGFVLLGMNWLG